MIFSFADAQPIARNSNSRTKWNGDENNLRVLTIHGEQSCSRWHGPHAVVYLAAVVALVSSVETRDGQAECTGLVAGRESAIRLRVHHTFVFVPRDTTSRFTQLNLTLQSDVFPFDLRLVSRRWQNLPCIWGDRKWDDTVSGSIDNA